MQATFRLRDCRIGSCSAGATLAKIVQCIKGRRSMSRGILLGLKYKEALIVKHLLRDKVDRDADEQRLYEKFTELIEDFRTANSIQQQCEAKAIGAKEYD
jgi:hypothetical protein